MQQLADRRRGSGGGGWGPRGRVFVKMFREVIPIDSWKRVSVVFVPLAVRAFLFRSAFDPRFELELPPNNNQIVLQVE